MKNEDVVGRHLLQVRGETVRATELGWRFLVFTPFKTFWLILINGATVYQFFLDSHHVVFNHPQSAGSLHCVVITWILLVVDLSLSILHRLWERVNRSQRYRPKSWFIIIIDVICAHPILLIYYSLFEFELPESLKWFVTIVDVLRLYRMFTFYSYLMSEIGSNQIFVHLVFYNLCLLLSSGLIAIFWHTVCVYLPSPGGLRGLIIYEEDEDEEILFFSAHMLIFRILMGSGINIFLTGSMMDIILILIPIILGFCLTNIFTIMLLADFMKQLEHNFKFRSFLKVADVHLKNFQAMKGVYEDFMSFYVTLWNLWSGIQSEESIEELPLSMRKEVLVDIAWDAIQHSHAMRYQGINFKRDIALKIRSILYRPGDYVIHYDEIISSLFYLVSGNLQVMSRYDNTSPIISFSRGTLLGGSSIVIPSISNFAIRCSSYCEMHSIGSADIFEVAVLYPWEVRYLHFRSYDRLQDAYLVTKVQQIFKTRQSVYDELLVIPEVKCIPWLKKRWKLINSYDTINEKEANSIANDIPLTEQFTSKYLDLYVMSEEVELKKNRFCLESMWPFVMEPECDFLEFWNSFILLLVIFDSIFLPYYISFTLEVAYFAEHATIFNQFMFMVDTYFHLITAVKTKGLLIMTSKAIMRYRLKRFEFSIDVLSALPVGLIMRLAGRSSKEAIIWDLLRLFKTWRARTFLTRMESNITSPQALPWFRHLIVYIFLVYWSSCILFYATCPNLVCHHLGWVEIARKIFENADFGEKYRCFSSYVTISLFYFMTVSNQLNASDIITRRFFEQLVIVILSVIIQTYLLYTAAHLIAISLLSKTLKISFVTLIGKTKKFISDRGLPKPLANSLINYLNLQWRYNKCHEFILRKPIFHDAPERLRSELKNYFSNVLKSYKLFEDDSEETRNMIDMMAEKARILLIPKNFIICTAGKRATCLTIVRKGYCRLISHLKIDIAKFPDGKVVGAGAMFPAVELVSKIDQTITAYTITDCECIVIDETDFSQALDGNKTLVKKLIQSTHKKQLVRKLLQNVDAGFQPMIEATHKSSFVLRKPFFCNKDNLMRVLLHLLYPKYCISPTGSFLYYWELSRYLIIPISANYFILYFSLFFPLQPTLSRQISLVFDTLSIVDLYIKSNTAYYNEMGVLMTDVCLTVNNYLATSFIIDILAAFPWQIIIKVNHVVDLPWLILATFKILPIYRVVSFHPILIKSEHLNLVGHIFTVATVFVTVVNYLGNMSILYLCFIEYNNDEYVMVYCKRELTAMKAFDHLNLLNVIVLNLSATIQILMKCKTEIIQTTDGLQMKLCIFFGFIMTFGRILFLANCCLWTISRWRDFIPFKQRVIHLLDYVKTNLPELKLEHLILNHCLNLWKNLMPDDVSSMLTKVHPTLREQVLAHLYFDKLRLVSFLKDADNYLLRLMSFQVQEVFVFRGERIVEEFEITKNIYLITEGEVVVSVGKISPATLGPGCIFGCFYQSGINRHIYNYEAVKHTSILKLNSIYFNSILKQFPMIHKRFKDLVRPSMEYIITGTEVLRQESSIDLTEVTITRTTSNASKNYVVAYIAVTYLVAYGTLVVLCLYITFQSTSCVIALAILDLLSLWKMITRLILPYVEPKTGLLVTDKKLIRRNYMATIYFYFNLIALFPYVGVIWLLPLKLLRLFEYLNVVMERRSSVHSDNWEVWAHGLLTIFLILFLPACFWTWLYRRNLLIYHYNGEDYEAIISRSKVESLLNCFLFCTMRFMGTARMKNLKIPTTLQQAGHEVLIVLLFTVIFGVIFGHTVHFVQTASSIKKLYESKMLRQRLYLTQRDLSPHILKCVWEHGELLWQKSYGDNLPRMLFNLTFPLKKKIMYGLFGRRLEQSYLFKNTHLEFIQNLCTKLVLTVYFPGESIVLQGDVDSTMYFVYSGEVDILRSDKDEEELLGIITVGELFGSSQGLYESRPHASTYKARSTSEILSLKREHWQDLMLFYHIQTHVVYRRAAELLYEYPIDRDYLE